MDESKVEELKVQLTAFLTRLEELEPSETSLEDVDRLLAMIEEMEEKMKPQRLE